MGCLMGCNAPGRVHFANRVSCTYYSDFVRQQRDELLVTGALLEWGKVGVGPPHIVDGLGVVKSYMGKLRVILDCRYLPVFAIPSFQI